MADDGGAGDFFFGERRFPRYPDGREARLGDRVMIRRKGAAAVFGSFSGTVILLRGDEICVSSKFLWKERWRFYNASDPRIRLKSRGTEERSYGS